MRWQESLRRAAVQDGAEDSLEKMVAAAAIEGKWVAVMKGETD
jgi:hypothetical protein